MAWNFRRSRKYGPFRISASKSGMSFSAGNRIRPETINTRGRRTTTWRIPGWGIWWSKSRKVK